ncbi:hypothetical protein NFI96_008271, partial [Prochilodus magdalenae]
GDAMAAAGQKVVLITGCSSGIGLKIAVLLAKDENQRYHGQCGAEADPSGRPRKLCTLIVVLGLSPQWRYSNHRSPSAVSYSSTTPGSLELTQTLASCCWNCWNRLFDCTSTDAIT